MELQMTSKVTNVHRWFQANGAERQACEEKLPLPPDGLNI